MIMSYLLSLKKVSKIIKYHHGGDMKRVVLRMIEQEKYVVIKNIVDNNGIKNQHIQYKKCF